MRNTKVSMGVERMARASVLFLVLMFGWVQGASALTASVNVWNGSCDAVETGNYVVFTASEYRGQINFSGAYFKSTDFSSGVVNKSWGNTGGYSIQLENYSGKFYAWYNPKDSTLKVVEGGVTGIIDVQSDPVCYNSGAVILSAVDVNATDHTLQWGEIAPSATDTIWKSAYDNTMTNLSYEYTYTEPFTIVTKVTEIATDEIYIHSTKIEPTLYGCGVDMTYSDRALCLGNALTLGCTYTGAAKYEWKDSNGNLYATTTTASATFKPQEAGTYTFVVYADGMKAASAKVIVMPMSNCNITVEVADAYVCLGNTTELSTNYTGAAEYKWYDENNTLVGTTTDPKITVAPSVGSSYTLYADGFLVGSVTPRVMECTFFIASEYPIASCLQDSNTLMAAGTAILSKITDPTAFVWEVSNDNATWRKLNEGSYKLRVAADSSRYYRVTYGNLSEVLYYEKPNCADNVYCNGLETKTLFYETFGFFMAADVYVSGNSLFLSKIDVNHKSTVEFNSDGTQSVAKNYESGAKYYTARVTNGDTLMVDTTATNTFYIRNFVAPDPFGYVVPATKFEYPDSNNDANQFVGTNGHLFLSENPMLGKYEADTWVRNAGLRLQDGYYAIVANPDTCDQNKNGDDFVSCSDYTGNKNGAMLFVNAGRTEISKAAIYAQKAPLSCPADRFNFGMSIRNATASDGTTQKNPVNLTVCLLKEMTSASQVLPDASDENVLAMLSTDNIEAGTEWQRFDKFIELSEKTDKVWVVIYNNGVSGDGNDMLLDDISFSVCIPKADLKAIVDGDTLTDEVVSCSGDEILLKASQSSAYLLSPVYIFQYQTEENGTLVWKDLKDYENDPLLMIYDTATVSTKEKNYWGDVNYRVIISDDRSVARRIADGDLQQVTECEFTYHQATTNIVIRNTYGGEMAPRDSVAFCNIEGTEVEIVGERLITMPDHEWEMSWYLADTTLLFKENVKGHATDTLRFTVLAGDKCELKKANGTVLGEFALSALDSLFFQAKDEGDCIFTQNIVTHAKMNLNLTTDEAEYVDCNSVTVAITKNYSEPGLTFDWSSVAGTATAVDEVTQTFVPDNLEKYSSISGIVKVKPVNVADKYCFLQDSIEVPYTVHNGHYKISITPSKDPVCVSSNAKAYDTEVLTLTANVVSTGMEAGEAEKLQDKIKSYQWNIVFSDGSIIDTTTATKTLSFSNKDLLDASLTQIKAHGMNAYIVASTTDVCQTLVQDTAGMGTSVEIREGGFTLELESVDKVCLNTDKSHQLKVVISPETALRSIQSLDFYHNGTKLADLAVSDDTFFVDMNSTAYPSIFTAGNTEQYKVSVYDDVCRSQNESNVITVRYNGYDWNFNEPDSCLVEGGNFSIIATIDSANAVNHIDKYVWKLNGSEVTMGNGFKLDYPVSQSMMGTFSLTTTDDGICPAVTHEFTSNISVRYEVSLTSETDKICSTESATVKSVVTPAASREFIKRYVWKAVDTLGVEKIILDGTPADSNIVLSAANFPDLFTAGNSFSIYVETEDGICDKATSNNKLDFDVNVPFTLSLTSGTDRLCYSTGTKAELKVTVDPEAAIRHIDKFTWTVSANGVDKTTETTGTTLDLATLSGWLDPADNAKYSVYASDGICVVDQVSDAIQMSINTPYTVDLTLDKSKACETETVILMGSNSQSADANKNYSYQYLITRNGLDTTIQYLANDPLLAQDDLNARSGFTPGEVLSYRLIVNDDDVCGPKESAPRTVTVQTLFKVHIEAEKDTLCKGDDMKMSIVSYTPAAAEQFVTMYSWQKVNAGSVGDLSKPLSEIANESGIFEYFVNVSDGICYGNDKFAPLQSDTVTVKVNEPIQATLAASSSVFCLDSSSDPLTLTATCTTGEPIRYEIFAEDGSMLNGEDSKDMSHSWRFSPSREHHQYTIKVYDGVCPAVSDPSGAVSIDLFDPIKFTVTIPEEDKKICLGETVHLSVVLSQGNPTSYTWENLAVESPHVVSNTTLEDVPLAAGFVNYKVTATDGVCPDYTVDDQQVEVFEQPVIELQLSKESAVIGSTVDLTAAIVKGAPVVYEWLGNAKPLASSEVNYLNDVLPSSTTKFAVYASDGVCPAAYSEMEMEVQIPTAFTPHHKDGLNDVFMRGFTLEVYDRYGMKVFEGDDGWDGRKGNVMADPGTYYCRVMLKDGKVYKGTIEIVKND